LNAREERTKRYLKIAAFISCRSLAIFDCAYQQPADIFIQKKITNLLKGML